MAEELPGPPVGDVSREAVAARKGYLYQDYQAALSWLALKENEFLYVEVAEDYVNATKSALIATQVKDVAKRLTLNDPDAKQALLSFVHLVKQNPSQRIRFAFLTTTSATRERQSRHRASEEGTIAYWQSIDSVEKIPALRAALMAIDLDADVHAYVAKRDDAALLEQLVQRFDWVLGQPPIDAVAELVSKAVASSLYREHGVAHAQGRKYAGNVLQAVQMACSRPREERFLDRASLEELLTSLATRTLPADEYDRLLEKSTIAEGLDVGALDKQLREDLRVFRKSRRFNGYDALSASRSLAKAVQRGGKYSGASIECRADALAWAARAVMDQERAEADDRLAAAAALCPTAEAVGLTSAFFIASENLPDAMARLSALKSPAARTAQYAIQHRSVQEPEGSGVALRWLEAAGYTMADLDEDGQAAVLSDLMATQAWDEAANRAFALDAQSINHPMLLLQAAIAHLAQAVPAEKRHEIVQVPPLLDPLDFPLGITGPDLRARAAAVAFFHRLCDVATELNLSVVEHHAREYLLWLSLHDHPERDQPRAELEARLKDPEQWMRWVPLALACKLPVDTQSVLERLWQHIAREGDPGFQGSRALLALLLASDPDPDSGPWTRAKPYMIKYFDSDMLTSLEAQMDIRAGRHDAAKAKLNGLPDSEPNVRIKRHLYALINKLAGADPVAARRAAYETNPGTFELEQLVLALAKARAWRELKPFAHALFARASTLENAERYVDALRQVDDWAGLETFLDAHPGLSEQSPLLADAATQLMLFRADWPAMRAALANPALPANLVRRRRRTMLVLSMQWHELNAEIDAALKADAREEASDLLELAVVAAILGRKADSQRMTQAAVAVSPSDPAILMAAYLQSVKGMWEGEESAGWLKHGIQLSGTDGPVQSKSMKELVDMAPAWRERNDQAWRNLQSGRLWLSAYAKMLNVQLSQVTVAAANRNSSETDTRRRTIIPAFSGARGAASMERVCQLAVDATALLTLGRLGLLDALKGAVDRLWVPHEIGLWLFEEFQKATFHQPRHFEESRRIMGYIAQGKLSICPRLPIGDKLSNQVGEELATLLRQAQTDQAEGMAAFVIRSSPVHIIDSMMDRNADLSLFADVLRSTRCLARSLEAIGASDAEKVETAELYLGRVDEGWPGDVLIPSPEVTLYLDDLSITYLEHVGLLEDLIRTGCRLVVHEQVRIEAESFEATRDAGDALRQVLVSIHDFLAPGIASGEIGMLPTSAERRGRPQADVTPGIDLFQPGIPVDAILVDDRFFNRFEQLEHSGAPTIRVFTSLDVLDHFLHTGVIDAKRWRTLRTNLRRAGYTLIPLAIDELREATKPVRLTDNGQMIEPVDLRAIRENAGLLQLRQILQLPAEMPWLMGFVDSVRSLLGDVWLGDLTDETRVRALTKWALGLVDLRNYAPNFPDAMSRERWYGLGLIPLCRFLTECTLSAPSRQRRDLLGAEIFEGMEWRSPRALDVLLRLVTGSVADLRQQMRTSNDPEEKSALAQCIVRLASELPRPVEQLLQSDDARAAAFGLEINKVVRLEMPEKPTFLRDDLWEAVRRAVYEGGTAQATDTGGREWTLTATDTVGLVRVRADLPPVDFADVVLMSTLPEERSAHLASLAERAGIDKVAVPPGIAELLCERPLSPAEIDDLQEFFALHPLPLFNELCKAVSQGRTTLARLFPIPAGYYERVVGKWRGERTIVEFSATPRLVPPKAPMETQLWLALLACGHSSTGPCQLVAVTTAEDVKAFIEKFAEGLDVWSLTGLLEAVIARPDALTALQPEIIALIHQFVAATDLRSGRLRLTSVLFMAVETRIRTHAADDVPPYWRRLAAAAHGALIERVFLSEGVDLDAMLHKLAGLTASYQASAVLDMWHEPKWAPFLLADHQLQQELSGRVLNAWFAARGNIGEETADPPLQQEIDALVARRDVFAAGMPGPTEGNVERTAADSAFVASTLEHLKNQDISFPNRWMVVGSIALAAELGDDVFHTLIDQLAEFGLAALSESSMTEIRELLARLAYVAAMNRDPKFAKTVLELSRRLVLEADGKLESSTCLYIGAILSAAEGDRESQKKSLVDCANFSANTCKDKEDASSCTHLLEGFIEADWSLGPLLVAPMAALRCVAHKLN